MQRFSMQNPKKTITVALTVLFAIAAVGCIQFGVPNLDKGNAHFIICDIHTPVTDGACATGGALLLATLLSVFLLGFVVSVRKRDAVNSLWKLYRFSYSCGNPHHYSSLTEAFRKGLIHPKIPHLVV